MFSDERRAMALPRLRDCDAMQPDRWNWTRRRNAPRFEAASKPVEVAGVHGAADIDARSFAAFQTGVPEA